jgi:hypothetical protein
LIIEELGTAKSKDNAETQSSLRLEEKRREEKRREEKRRRAGIKDCRCRHSG